MEVKKAVIPAAGFGTRFLPATKAQPKEMLPLVDKPTIQYIVEEAVEAGIEDILIITGRNKSSIEDHFDKSVELEMELEQKGKTELLKMVQEISQLVNLHYVRQKSPRGLGDAILCARTFIGSEPFAVLLGDDVIEAPQPVIGEMMDVYARTENPVLGVQKVSARDVDKYGIVDYGKSDGDIYEVCDLVEKPARDQAPSRLAILGRYIITPDIFPVLEETEEGKGGEIQLTDALKTLSQKRQTSAFLFTGQRYDIGNRSGFLQANVELALAREDIGPEFKKYLKKIVSEFA
ncbi:MAG: UTP--glucose-1-phosphate uridylyltransferase GalU [Bacillota bacterium]